MAWAPCGPCRTLRRLRRSCTTGSAGIEATARRLARFGAAAAPAAPDLRRLWLHTPHSYARAVYLEALTAIGATAGLNYAHTESLWDCQEQARLLGIAHAPDNRTTRARVTELRDDPMEVADVRAAAAERLAAA
ncbi:hypothetical protein [Streptodolium elevatio]|uniref:Uncharacterized protein n=1 Tax=Streptodolium elevatio TaxID=3157996 RepID=A0ABV3DEB2_9ACTN